MLATNSSFLNRKSLQTNVLYLPMNLITKVELIHRLILSCFKDIGMRQLEFVASVQFIFPSLFSVTL